MCDVRRFLRAVVVNVLLEVAQIFGNLVVIECLGFVERRVSPTVLGIMRNLTLLQKELYAVKMSFGSCQMKRGSTVVITGREKDFKFHVAVYFFS